MARTKLRRLGVDDRLFLYRMDWSYDRDGTRIVEVTLYPADPQRQRPRGQPLRAHLVAREAAYVDTSAALPADVRAVLDRGLELGWDGSREFWLLPPYGLVRPNLVLLSPTRLRAWASEATLYDVTIADPALAEPLARELAVPPVAESIAGPEDQWRTDHTFILRTHGGHYLHIYRRSLTDLVAALELMTRLAPQTGMSVRTLPTGHAPSTPPPSPATWAARPGATRHRGWRERDELWTFPTPQGPQLEALEFHPDAPELPWRWLTLRADESLERRYPRPAR